jgi:hypothetical protein
MATSSVESHTDTLASRRLEFPNGLDAERLGRHVVSAARICTTCGAAQGSAPLRPERGTHVDVGIEQRIGASGRWQVTVFSREETGILREPERYQARRRRHHLSLSWPLRQRLDWMSRGVELVVDRQSATGLSGWAPTRMAKPVIPTASATRCLRADFDQRSHPQSP